MCRLPSRRFIGHRGGRLHEHKRRSDRTCHVPLSTSEEGQQQLVDAQIQIPNLIDMAEEWAADTESVPSNKQEFLDVVQRIRPFHAGGKHVYRRMV